MTPPFNTVDISRCKLEFDPASRFMMNFEGNKGLTNEKLEEIQKFFSSKGCDLTLDEIRFIKKGGVRTRLYTYDLNEFGKAMKILGEFPKIFITYRGKPVKNV